MRHHPETIFENSINTIDPEFNDLLHYVKKNSKKYKVIKALIEKYPLPVASKDLFFSGLKQGKMYKYDLNVVEITISRIRHIIKQNSLPFKIKKIPQFGYQLLKSSDSDKEAVAWWGELSYSERKILLEIIENNGCTVQALLTLLWSIDLSHVDPEVINYNIIELTISRLRKKLVKKQLGTIPPKKRNSDKEYIFQPDEGTDVETLKKDLQSALTT